MENKHISKGKIAAIILGIILVLALVIVIILVCINKSGQEPESPDTQLELPVSEGQEQMTESESQEESQVTETQLAPSEGQGTDYSVCTDFSADEVEAFAGKVKEIFANEDWKSLADLVYYPITIDQRYYATKEDFLKEDWSTLFPKDYKDEIAKAELSELFCNWQGIAMAGGQLWMGEVKDQLYVISINCATGAAAQTTPGLEGHWEIDADMTTKNLKKVSSLQEIFGTGIHAGSNLDFKDDGSFEMGIGLSVYYSGTYEITGDCVLIKYENDEGSSQETVLTRGDKDDTVYIVFEYEGEEIYWKKLN